MLAVLQESTHGLCAYAAAFMYPDSVLDLDQDPDPLTIVSFFIILPSKS